MRVRCNRPEDLAAIEKAPVAPGGLGGAVVWRDQLIKSHLIYPHHCTVGGLDPPVCPGKSGAGTGPPPTPHCYPSPTPSPARRCSADLLCCRWWYWWDRVAPVHGEHKRRGRTRATDGAVGGVHASECPSLRESHSEGCHAAAPALADGAVGAARLPAPPGRPGPRFRGGLVPCPVAAYPTAHGSPSLAWMCVQGGAGAVEGPYWSKERNGPASPEQDTCCRGGMAQSGSKPPCSGPGLGGCTPIGTPPPPSRPIQTTSRAPSTHCVHACAG